jgi:DNA-binding transcriptional LysR family regulator
VAAILAPALGLTVLRPPKELRLEGFTMSALWHERTQQDPALAWLRDLLAAVAKES